MLKLFKDYKGSIHILNCILDLMKLTLKQQYMYMLSVIHSQCYTCWCSGDFRSQGISKHGIDPQKLEYSISSIRSAEINSSQTVLGCWRSFPTRTCPFIRAVAAFIGRVTVPLVQNTLAISASPLLGEASVTAWYPSWKSEKKRLNKHFIHTLTNIWNLVTEQYLTKLLNPFGAPNPKT